MGVSHGHKSKCQTRAAAMPSAPVSHRCGSGFSGPVMDPIFIGRTAQFEFAFANRSEPLRDAFRRVIVGPNEARSPRKGKVPEQPVAGRPGRLSREPLPPEGPVERISDLRFRPVERLEDADAPDKSAAGD